MAYTKPSVLVYQELQNAGGVANVTPDLGSVIIGPLYNVVRVDLSDADSLATTLGGQSSDLSANSPITNAPYILFSNKVTVTSPNHGLEVGDVIAITGDTATVIPEDTQVVVSEVSRDLFSFSFTEADSEGTPTFDYSLVGLRVNLTGSYPGQLVEQSSVQLLGTDVYVKTTEWEINVAENIDIASGFNGDDTRDQFRFRWNNAQNKYLIDFTPAGATPEALLPDNSGKHIKKDDKVIVEFRPPNHLYDGYATVASGVVTMDVLSKTHRLADNDYIRVTAVFGDTGNTNSPTTSTNYQVTDVDNSNSNHKLIQFSAAVSDTEAETGQTFALVDGVVTVTDAGHTIQVGDYVRIQNATGGAIADYTVAEVTSVDGDDFTFAYDDADATGTLDYEHVVQVRYQRLGGYSIANEIATITRTSHGYEVGDLVSVLNEAGPGGLSTSIQKTLVLAVPTADTFTIAATGLADSSDASNLVSVAREVKHVCKVDRLGTTVTNSGVTITNGIKLDLPLEDFTYTALLAGYTTVTATVKVYRKYNSLEVPATVTLDNGTPEEQIDFDGLDNDYLVLLNTASAYATLSSTMIPGVDEDSYEILSGKFYVGYRAVRQDKYSTVLTINDSAELEANLGEVSELNPLALGTSLALSNTTTSVMAVSLKAEMVDDVPVFDWDTALELLENQAEAYALAPLTQDESVLSKFKTHVLQMSEPKYAAWRVAIVNTEIPSVKYILSSATEAADPEVALTTGRTKDIGGVLYFSDSATAGGPNFIEAGVTPGDLLVVTASGDTDLIGSWTVDEVINGKTLKLVEAGFSTPTISVGASATYYIVRTLTKAMQAEHILATSETFNSNRIWHVQPDSVGVNVRGTVKYLPGYYLCAALSGMTAGFPVQQGFTNISVAGIDDLRHSNFYFKREQLDSTISDKAGTCWFVQDAQGGVPYCRHELTTDNSVLEYREILKVKNWDFLSYYYYEKMRPYIGSWNITDDTLSVMKQVMIAASELLLRQKLPRIGAPLVAYQTPTIEQDAVNKDTTNVTIPVSIADPNNYTNLYIVI